MKLLAVAFIIMGFVVPTSQTERVPRPCSPVIATCYGDTPCSACKTCNYCKHCNAGGTCGICDAGKKAKVPPKEKKKETSKPVASTRCKAITKKGSQCSRTASSGGYCWQH